MGFNESLGYNVIYAPIVNNDITHFLVHITSSFNYGMSLGCFGSLGAKSTF